MRVLSLAVRYVAQLRPGKIVLWCYLAWYIATAAMYFDSRPSIWLSSLGISGIIGSALLLSVNRAPAADRWQVFRLFMMPFGVSSFSALIKDQGFFLVFAPDPRGLALQAGAGTTVLVVVLAVKVVAGKGPRAAPNNSSKPTPLRGAA